MPNEESEVFIHHGHQVISGCRARLKPTLCSCKLCTPATTLTLPKSQETRNRPLEQSILKNILTYLQE